jgi:hypothetical protein
LYPVGQFLAETFLTIFPLTHVIFFATTGFAVTDLGVDAAVGEGEEAGAGLAIEI